MSFFLFKYVTAIFTPRAIFTKRHGFNWFQLLFLWLFLNSLVIAPLAFQYSQLQTYEMERLVENGLAALNDQTSKALQQGTIDQRYYTGESKTIETEQAIVAVLPNPNEQTNLRNSSKYVIILTNEEWEFYYPTGQTIKFPIQTQSQSLSQLENTTAVKNFVNQEWFLYHKFAAVAMVTFVSMAMIYFGSFMVIFVGAATILLVKKSRLFSIETYQECVHLLLNCFGLPTLLAMGAAWFTGNPALITNIQVFGTVLMLVFVFYKTQFRDVDSVEQI